MSLWRAYWDVIQDVDISEIISLNEECIAKFKVLKVHSISQRLGYEEIKSEQEPIEEEPHDIIHEMNVLR